MDFMIVSMVLLEKWKIIVILCGFQMVKDHLHGLKLNSKLKFKYQELNIEEENLQAIELKNSMLYSRVAKLRQLN